MRKTLSRKQRRTQQTRRRKQRGGNYKSLSMMITEDAYNSLEDDVKCYYVKDETSGTYKKIKEWLGIFRCNDKKIFDNTKTWENANKYILNTNIRAAKILHEMPAYAESAAEQRARAAHAAGAGGSGAAAPAAGTAAAKPAGGAGAAPINRSKWPKGAKSKPEYNALSEREQDFWGRAFGHVPPFYVNMRIPELAKYAHTRIALENNK